MGMAELGVKTVTAQVEWRNSGYPKCRDLTSKQKKKTSCVCDLCAPLNGVVLTLQEAAGLIPRHPNCMCSWSPARGIEREGQKRTYQSITDAIRQSQRAAVPKYVRADGNEDEYIQKGWAGKLEVAKERPKPLVPRKKPARNSLLARFDALSRNAFCPTGEGGGVDPTCSPPKSLLSLFADPSIALDEPVIGIPIAMSKPYTTETWGEMKGRVMRKNVLISSLFATQPTVDTKRIQAYDKDMPAIYVVKNNNKMYIYDGHHRVVSAKLANKKTISAIIIDKDAGVVNVFNPSQPRDENGRWIQVQGLGDPEGLHTHEGQKKLITFLRRETGISFRPHGSLKVPGATSSNDVDVLIPEPTDEEREKENIKYMREIDKMDAKLAAGEITQDQWYEWMYGGVGEQPTDPVATALGKKGFKLQRTMMWSGVMVDRYYNDKTMHAVEVWQKGDDDTGNPADGKVITYNIRFLTDLFTRVY
jgi:hypothetical protein